MNPPYRDIRPKPKSESQEPPPQHTFDPGESMYPEPVFGPEEAMIPFFGELLPSPEDDNADVPQAQANGSLQEITQPLEPNSQEASPSSTRIEIGSRSATPSSRSASRRRTPSRPVSRSRSRDRTPSDPDLLDRLMDWMELKFIPVDESNFLDSQPFAACDLRATLKTAVWKISFVQDPALYNHIQLAGGPHFRVAVDIGKMYKTRPVEW